MVSLNKAYSLNRDLYSSVYEPEPWENASFTKLAKIGRLTRAAIMGSPDFSVMSMYAGKYEGEIIYSDGGSKIKPYRGLKSSWLKRRYGIHSDRRLMKGPYNSFSPWISGVLSSLLAWPGARVESGFENIDMQNLGDILDERLKLLAKLYGKASETLMLPVDFDIKCFFTDKEDILCDENIGINIAVVQAMPLEEGEYKTLIDNDDVGIRTRMRRCLSDILMVLHKTFKMKSHVDARQKNLNIIVFPELCVHPNDVKMLKRVADKFNCIIFFGETYQKHPYENDSYINCGRWLIPQKRNAEDVGSSYIELIQGKKYPTTHEYQLIGDCLKGFRPVQWLINGCIDGKKLWTITASICYDSTDIKLSADLRDCVDGYLISAQNQDVGVFDTMAESLRYRMYNHTIIVNTANYGGSTIQAPYRDSYKRTLMHIHGAKQPMVAIVTMNLNDFGKKDGAATLCKTAPAGYEGRVMSKIS
jgi:hypothetical protein